MSEVTATLQFIITIELLGLIGFPISHKLFSKLPDRGWGFSKIVGLLVSAWVIWILSSLRLVPFTPANVLATTLFVGLLSWLLLFRTKLRAIPAQTILFIVIEELLFLGIIVAWTFLRGLSPDYNGLEKFMDYGFMLSAMQTKYFPPLDHFLSGETINYYYYGHYIAAFMATLSRVPANLAYNLQMSLLFGLTAMQSFALASGLYHLISRLEVKRLPWRSISTGILGALLVSFFGNLHTAIFYPGNPTGYWYPDATRFIENTIHEFPIYSFIVNDLHGHVSDIPMVLFVLGILLIFVLKQRERLVFGTVRDLIRQMQIPTICILAFVIGTMYATNAWDFAIYLVLSGLVFWTINASLCGETIIWRQFFHYHVLLLTATQSILLLILAIIYFAPFWASLLPIFQGIGIVPFGSHSPLWQLAVLWGVRKDVNSERTSTLDVAADSHLNNRSVSVGKMGVYASAKQN